MQLEGDSLPDWKPASEVDVTVTRIVIELPGPWSQHVIDAAFCSSVQSLARTRAAIPWSTSPTCLAPDLSVLLAPTVWQFRRFS